MPFESPFNALRNTIGSERSLFGITDSQSHDATGGVKSLGQFGLDASQFRPGAVIQFRSVLSVSDGSLAATVVLYDLINREIIATQMTSATTPTMQATTLTVGVGAGTLKTSPTIYEVRLSVSGSLVTDLVSLGSALITIN